MGKHKKIEKRKKKNLDRLLNWKVKGDTQISEEVVRGVVDLEEHQAAIASWERQTADLCDTIARQKHTLGEMKSMVTQLEVHSEQRFEKSRQEIVLMQNARQQAVNEVQELSDRNRAQANQILREIRAKEDAIDERNKAIKYHGRLETDNENLKNHVTELEAIKNQWYRQGYELKALEHDLRIAGEKIEQCGIIQVNTEAKLVAANEANRNQAITIDKQRATIRDYDNSLAARNAENQNLCKELGRLQGILNDAGIEFAPKQAAKKVRTRPAPHQKAKD